MTTVLLLLLLLFFLSGAPLFAVMVGAAAIGALGLPRGLTEEFGGYMASLFGLGTGDQATVLSTIPMFIYAGYVMAASKTADRLVRFANALLGWMPGGLAIVTIVASAIFTTFTGASGVTIVALGGLLMPALTKQRYPERFSLGLITGTGSCGLLLPPAVPLFVFGTIYGLQEVAGRGYTERGIEWATTRFLFAGIVPSLVLLGCLSIVAVFVAVKNRLPRQGFDSGELGRSFVVAFPEAILPFGVIGLIASGIGPTQVAGLTVVYLIVLEVFVYKDLAWKSLWNISTESLALTGTIFIIVLTSALFTNFLVTAKVPDALVAWTQSHVDSRLVFLLMLNALLIVVGMMMDVFSAVVIVLPLIAPVAYQYGIDPYHLGVIFLLNLEIGYLTPPVGLNLFIASFKFRRPVMEVVRSVIPFMGAMIVALMIVTYVPALTVVPEGERYGTAASLRQYVQETADELRAVREVGLVIADGSPVLGADGKPVVKKLAECDAITDSFERDKCKGLFFDVSSCRKPGAATDCEQKAIAGWVNDNMEYVSVTEVTLVDGDGKPLTGKDGAPRVWKLADCDGEREGIDGDTCKELFVAASACRNAPPEGKTLDECKAEAIGEWVSDNADELGVEDSE